MQYAILAYFLPFSNTLSLENMIGNLIAPLTKLLYHIIGNSMSRGDLQNIMQWVWQDKSICLPQMNCQRLHIDGKKYSRNQSCHFFKNLQHVTFVQIRPVSYHFLDVLFKKLWVIRLLSYLVRAIENILNIGDSEYLEKQ